MGNQRARLLDELSEFVTWHSSCGSLTADATEPAWNGYQLTVACSCGVAFLWWVTREDATEELAHLARLN